MAIEEKKKEIKKNVTSIFMVPTLKINKEKLFANGFINGYTRDAGRDMHFEDSVYVLFRPDNLVMFKEFVDAEYQRTKSIVDDYDYEGGFIVLVYELNPKFKKDFNLVRKGKYSKTSKEFQNIFSKVVKVVKGGLSRDELSLQYRVFNKTDEMRKYWEDRLGVEFDEEMEVWQGFVEEDETLYIDKLKELYVE